MSVRRRRPGVASVSSSASMRHGGVRVAEVQRARMLSSAVQVVSEYGYGKMSVARVTGGARVSRRTFYDLFEDREDCFLAVFDDAMARVTALVVGAYEGETGGWRERVRAALGALLVFLDEEPGLGSLLVVDALSAGPRVLERRAGILEGLSGVLGEGASLSNGARELSALTGEGVVGAVFSVIHTRLLAKRPGSMVELLNPLMGMIVLPYLGQAAARRELERSLPRLTRTSTRVTSGGVDGQQGDPLEGLAVRLTYRTLRVLTAVGERSGASNREVGERAGVSDQGQISKLLARLERLGLVQNTGAGQLTGASNAWSLTPAGDRVMSAIGAHTSHAPATSHRKVAS
jgi:AcrR family transcriptional regulator